MPTYGCLILFFFKSGTPFDLLTPIKLKWLITAIVFSFTFVFPAFYIFSLYKMKRISSLHIRDQKERTYPYLITACFYIGLFYMLRDVQVWGSIKLLILGAGIAILLTSLINLKYKISAHAIGLGGLLGGLMTISFFSQINITLYYMLIILVAGITCSARLYLQEHRPSQIYSGFFMGFLIQCLTFFSLHFLAFD
jgi:membrane-associated HD superfamily phosphohydrolase